MNVMQWKNAALLALALLVVGCSSNSSKEPEPAELVDFKPEVVLDKQWSRSIGEGQGETYNLLTPVVYGGQIYAADVEGLVLSMDRETGKVNWKTELDVRVSGGVGAGYGLVLVGTLNGAVIALDVESGEERWRANVRSEVLSRRRSTATSCWCRRRTTTWWRSKPTPARSAGATRTRRRC